MLSRTEHHPFILWLGRTVMQLVSDFHLTGQDTLPPPPYCVTGNHLAYADTFAGLASMPQETIVPLVASKLRDSPVGPLINLGKVIWIDQNTPDRRAIREILRTVEAGYSIALSPEGTRSRTGGLQEAKEGAAFLVRKTNIPVVPWAVWGTEKLFKAPRPEVHVHIGKPYRLPEDRISLENDTDRMMCALAALLPEQYHGYYAGHPLIEEMKAQVL